MKNICRACEQVIPLTKKYSKKYCHECSQRLLLSGGGRNRTRELVRIRDHDTCKKCGKVWKYGERKFDVHHLSEDRNQTRTYDLISSSDGMITLCHGCHLGTHKIVVKRVTEEESKEIISLHKRGLSNDKIALRLRLAYLTVRRHLKNYAPVMHRW